AALTRIRPAVLRRRLSTQEEDASPAVLWPKVFHHGGLQAFRGAADETDCVEVREQKAVLYPGGSVKKAHQRGSILGGLRSRRDPFSLRTDIMPYFAVPATANMFAMMRPSGERCRRAPALNPRS